MKRGLSKSGWIILVVALILVAIGIYYFSTGGSSGTSEEKLTVSYFKCVKGCLGNSDTNASYNCSNNCFNGFISGYTKLGYGTDDAPFVAKLTHETEVTRLCAIGCRESTGSDSCYSTCFKDY